MTFPRLGLVPGFASQITKSIILQSGIKYSFKFRLDHKHSTISQLDWPQEQRANRGQTFAEAFELTLCSNPVCFRSKIVPGNEPKEYKVARSQHSAPVAKQVRYLPLPTMNDLRSQVYSHWPLRDPHSYLTQPPKFTRSTRCVS